MRYSAYVPCCNDAATIRAAVESVLAQTLPPAEVLVVDDASTDASLAQLAGLDIRVIRHESNLGRGAVRARAMAEAREEFVLSCDATNRLPPGFAAAAAPLFAAERTAAAFGPLADPVPRGVASRWRARHLFRQDDQPGRHARALLSTYGTFVRRGAAASVGGFTPTLRATEDADLGRRLLAAGYDVVFAPELTVWSNTVNSAAKVLERYWRWNYAAAGRAVLRSYPRLVWYSWRTMIAQDLRAGDWPAAAVSALCPHYCAARSLFAR